MRVWAIGVALMLAQAAWAEAPNDSKRPVTREGPLAAQQNNVVATETLEKAEKPARRGLFSSIRPLFRSRKVEKEARAQRKLQAKGAICGDLAIQGETVGRVPGRLNGCGIENAVRVKSVSGITLSQRSVMDCNTATALKSWVDRTAKPALAKKGGGLKEIRVAAHYACRTRNSQKGARISEHGKGRAIDISGFRLANGAEISVLKGWSSRRYGKALRKSHKGACGPFGTVLGPNADKFHRDHFHFDTARYRSGSYCK